MSLARERHGVISNKIFEVLITGSLLRKITIIIIQGKAGVCKKQLEIIFHSRHLSPKIYTLKEKIEKDYIYGDIATLPRPPPAMC